jgi:hypothetical protein
LAEVEAVESVEAYVGDKKDCVRIGQVDRLYLKDDDGGIAEAEVVAQDDTSGVETY